MTRRGTFTARLIGAALLVGAADLLLFGPWIVPAPGVFALAWTAIVLAVAHRPHRRAASAAALFGAVMIDDPSLLGWTMFWCAASLAALLGYRRFDDASRWAQRLALHGLCGLVAPFRDLRVLSRSARRRTPGRTKIAAIGKAVAVPLAGSSLFLALFAGANPLIGHAFAQIHLPGIGATAPHVVAWIGVILTIWPSLRPGATALRSAGALPTARIAHLPLGTLTLSLVCFNLVFALPNALDLVFLWSGAALPGGVTLADYAHRGAYLLIATALLAGLFVLVALHPDSEGARSPLVRRLLVLWVAQNLLLVASSILRLIDYIRAYSLTEWRIAALLWMGLVGAGLVLICWRLLAGRSAAWLINANALAAASVLGAANVVDLGATAAAWNVSHVRAAQALDLCYMRGLGASALLPLIALERRMAGDRLRDQVAFLRAEAMDDAAARRLNPWTASLRNTRRLAAAKRLLGAHALGARATPNGRSCDGSIRPAPPPTVPPPAAPPTSPVAPVTGPLTMGGER